MNKKKITTILLMFLFICIGSLVYHQDAQAAGGYYAQVNKGTNVVTMFDSNGNACQAFTCSAGNATPIGIFYTSNKYTWHVLDGNVYGQYCTRINGGVLFHSVWYYAQDKSTQSYVQYNKLGSLASHGCVRLTVAAAKWIYDNCPSGMKVVIINGTAANDPLGKPATIHVNANQKMGWDPTDPDPNNPYRSSFPTINTAGVPTTVEYASGFYAWNGVSARDSLGNDITASIQVTGGVNDRQLGSYVVNYFVTDALGRSASASVTVRVVDSKAPTITGVKASQTKEYNSTLKLLSGIKATNAPGADLTSRIQVRIVYPGKSNEVNYKSSTIKLNKLGTYKIRYYVTNPNNGAYTVQESRVKVQDTKAPKISGVKSAKTIEYKKTLNLRRGITAKLVSGKKLTAKILVYMKKPGGKWFKMSTTKSKKYTFTKLGTYQVKYICKNPTSKKAATKITKITVKDTKAPVISGVSSKTTSLEYATVKNLRSGVSAKLVSGKSLTSKILVYEKKPGSSSWVRISTNRSKKYKFSTLGTYQIKCVSTNPTSKKAASKIKKYKVQDTKAPVITGTFTALTAEYQDTMDLESGVSAKLVSGKNMTADLNISVKEPESESSVVLTAEQRRAYVFAKTGTYEVSYSCSNPTGGKSAVKTRQIVIKDTKAPVISGEFTELTVSLSQTMDLLEGITAARVSGADLTDQIKVSVAFREEEAVLVEETEAYQFAQAGQYTITYMCTNPDSGESSSVTRTITVVEGSVVQPQDQSQDQLLQVQTADQTE